MRISSLFLSLFTSAESDEDSRRQHLDANIRQTIVK